MNQNSNLSKYDLLNLHLTNIENYENKYKINDNITLFSSNEEKNKYIYSIHFVGLYYQYNLDDKISIKNKDKELFLKKYLDYFTKSIPNEVIEDILNVFDLHDKNSKILLVP